MTQPADAAERPSPDEIRRELGRLQPEIPWTHHFDFGDGLETISERIDEKYYRKAIGLKKLGDLAGKMIETHTKRGAVAGARILDVASAEGGHAIALAQSGAREVLGIEGRRLYVDRARFVARMLGLDNVSFRQGDVRKIDPAEVGSFDFVLCSGILHHLGADDFVGFLRMLAAVTGDTMMLYTHVSTPRSIEKFRLEEGPAVGDGYAGHRFREHSDRATEKERLDKVRASLDNTHSFWATEESLLRALRDSGFKTICKIFEPHVFSSFEDRNIRVIIIARK